MEYEKIRQLAELMREMNLTGFEYSEGGAVLKMRRDAEGLPQITADDTPSAETQLRKPPQNLQAEGFIVTSPMVGVFYEAPGVGKKPYVSIGDKVSPGDVLCIIEAMKIMNEITAERGGVITGIFAENKQVVEFGQPLFSIGTDE